MLALEVQQSGIVMVRQIESLIDRVDSWFGWPGRCQNVESNPQASPDRVLRAFRQ